MDKKDYESPKLEIAEVETESNIVDSGTYRRVELEDLQKDTTPDAPYNGDIWLNS